MDMREIEVVSTLDGSKEKCLYLPPPAGAGPAPLLVGLHTWSFDRFNQVGEMQPRCAARGWGLILPEFRGSNLVTNPRARQACASRLAMQDIVDAVESVLNTGGMDPDRVFLLGGSGGGHMALMMAAYAPERWSAVSAWVPIVDLATWHAEKPGYAPGIAACCGGMPGSNPETDREYRERSPIFHADRIARVNLSLHHGRYDRSVPYSHSWRMAEALEALKPKRFFFDLFDGEHELRYDVAFAWFDTLLKKPVERKLTG